MPLVASQYLFEDDTVPFLPIVLKGILPMYCQTLNTTSFSQDRLLRLIEYGVNPSFILTACESELLANTPLEEYFSTCYDDWLAYIADTYQTLSEALSSVQGCTITAHTAIETGRIRVSYSNGISLYINYTDEPWQHDGVFVMPHSCLARKGA